MSAEIFGTLPDGRVVQRLTLQSDALTVQVLDLGAIVQDVRLQDVDYPLVLGFPEAGRYLAEGRYFGAAVGRFANRIGEGRFQIDGRDYQTDRNFRGRHSLHGGADGSDVHIWQIRAVSADRATLTLDLPDGHMGFPGNLAITADIAVAGSALSFVFTATTDAATPCSIAHHGYFNLDGTASALEHQMMIDAQHYLPVDDDLIPTGEVREVAGTLFDFRQERTIGDAGYDHNFCLASQQQPLRLVARLSGQSGVSMEIETTACGIQFYDGAYISGLAGLDGRVYEFGAGVALETQQWPDAPNHPDFPCAILGPGDIYSETTIYRFSS